MRVRTASSPTPLQCCMTPAYKGPTPSPPPPPYDRCAYIPPPPTWTQPTTLRLYCTPLHWMLPINHSTWPLLTALYCTNFLPGPSPDLWQLHHMTLQTLFELTSVYSAVAQKPKSPKAHRRRIYTEEKAKVVASSWGTELLQFFVSLSILH